MRLTIEVEAYIDKHYRSFRAFHIAFTKATHYDISPQTLAKMIKDPSLMPLLLFVHLVSFCDIIRLFDLTNKIWREVNDL